MAHFLPSNSRPLWVSLLLLGLSSGLFFGVAESIKAQPISTRNKPKLAYPLAQVSNPQEEQLIEAVYLNQEAERLYHQGDAQGAIALYQQALAIFRQINVPAGAGRSLQGIGEVYLALQQEQEALSSFQEALKLFQSINHPESIAYTQQYLGQTYEQLGDRTQAITHYQQARQILEQLRRGNPEDPQSIRTSLILTESALAALAFKQGDYLPAITRYQTVLNLQREADDKIGQAYTLNNLGVVYANASQYALALDHYHQALKIVRDLANNARIRYLGAETAILNNLSSLCLILGEINQALEFSAQAATLYQTWIKGSVSGSNIPGLELLRDALSQSYLSPQIIHQSLAIRPPLGDELNVNFARAGEAVNSLNLAQIYAQQGELNQALELTQNALKTYQELNHQPAVVVSLNQLGQIYQQLGQLERAMAIHEQAIQLANQWSDGESKAQSYSLLAQAYNAQQKPEQALKFYQQSLAEYSPKSAGSILAQNEIGRLLIAQKKYSEAVQILTLAMDNFEALRPGLNDAQKVSLFEQGKTIYQHLQQALIAQNQEEKALEIAERSRGRAFVDLLARLATSQPQVNPPSPTVAQIRQVAQQQQATLVEYSLIGENSLNPELYIWVITPEGKITFRQSRLDQVLSPAGQGQVPLTRFVEQSRNILLSQRKQQSEQRLTDLYQLLIEPIADLLPTDPEKKVIFVPQGSLFLVPFPALRDEQNQYLIERHTILTTPSLQVLSHTHQLPKRRGEGALIVGNPTMPRIAVAGSSTPVSLAPLPGAETEAKAIATALGYSALIGDGATEKAVIQQMQRARIIHLATHGLLDEVKQISPTPGALALAVSPPDDGLLTPQEILSLRLNADLVVLSACHTGRGRITGDGVLGLSRAFLGAGARSTIVSLWAVPDQPTASLMIEFYAQWVEKGDRALALRQAMLHTLKDYPDPTHWAAFTLIGEAQD
ncbi:CHAT domain-containing protein [Spirulina subsalsa FACHB-351]|uniref:CHAT domain-containing protein n=1 Tax=Spirulina subsalsa FACHB-351 TaxID=234711 RepID=A0ABT3L6V7_9CYAN|nr:CHAT domain-containing protein [Spirulina subsalsa]MCW6037246.1 CHAT domain-containing protein [Spirulina subsalsa FACHB-351]